MIIFWDVITFGIILTLQEVPLRCYYCSGLPLQYCCDTIVLNMYAYLKEELKNNGYIQTLFSVCTGTNFVWHSEKYQSSPNAI